MILGTHNSLTAYPLKGWCKLLGWLSWTAKCQDKDIYEQYEDGVRYFNLQVGLHNKDWIGSHGLFWYDIRLWSVLKFLNGKKDCHVQIYLDNHFFEKQDKELFAKLIRTAMFAFKYVKFEDVRIEKDWSLIHKGDVQASEKFWTILGAKKWYTKIPYPKLWARLNNKKYKDENESDYLMLDFFEL